MREDVASSTHSTRRPGVRWTPATKPPGDPSINFQVSMKDHIFRNKCSTFVTFPVDEAIWNMFMNDRMWDAFYFGEEGDKFKIIVVNHLIPKTQTMIGVVLTRLEHHYGKLGTQDP